MAYTLLWHEPIDSSDLKRALEIERELGRQRPIDSEPVRDGERVLDRDLILEGPRNLNPVGDLRYQPGSEGRRRPADER